MDRSKNFEPVIEPLNTASSLEHEKVRDVAHVSQITCQENNNFQSGEDVPLNPILACVAEYIYPLLQLTHLLRYQYVDCMFKIAFLGCTERLARLWGTYGPMGEHNMFGVCRGEDYKPIAVFNSWIVNMGTVASVELYYARFMEVKKRGYTFAELHR